MLKCFHCPNKATTQCKCQQWVFCEKCSFLHVKDHFLSGSEAEFREIKIKLSEKTQKELKDEVRIRIKQISSQKNYISEQAKQLKNYIDQQTLLTHKTLDNLANNLKKLAKKTKLNEKEAIEVEKIYKTRMAFDKGKRQDCEKLISKTFKDIGNNFSLSSIGAKDGIVLDLGVFVDNHSEKVNSVVTSIDMQLAVSGSSDKLVKVWNLAENRLEVLLTGHTSIVNCVALTSDNKKVLSGSYDGTVRVWNVVEKRLEEVLTGHSGPVWTLAISSDDKFALSGASDKTVRVWDLLSKKIITVLNGHSDVVRDLYITSDKRTSASCSINEIIIWDIDNQSQKAKIERKSNNKIALNTKKDMLIIILYNNQLVVWNLIKNSQEALFKGHEKVVNSVVMSSDNAVLLSGSSDKTIKIWDMASQTQHGELSGHSGEVNGIALTSDNKILVSGSSDNTVRIWDLIEKIQLAVLNGHADYVKSIALTHDNRFIISGSSDNTICIWNLEDHQEEAILSGHTSGVNSLAITYDNLFLISGSYDKTINVWNLPQKKRVSTFIGHTDYIKSVAVTNDNQFVVSGSCDKTVRVWSLFGIEHEAIFTNDKEAHAVISGDDCYVYCTSNNGGIRVYDLLEKKENPFIRIYDVEKTRKILENHPELETFIARSLVLDE